MNGASAIGADAAAELRAAQAEQVAQCPQQRHGRIGVHALNGPVDEEIRHFPCSLLLLQSIEISDDVLPLVRVGDAGEHLGAVHDALRFIEKAVETDGVPGDVRAGHRR